MASEQAELPRSVRKGPLITVKCECGERRELHYGEQWKCESCGRRFDTRKIPIEEYAAIRRTQIRYRLFPLLAGILLLVAVIVFWIDGQGVQRGGRGHVPARLVGLFWAPVLPLPLPAGVGQEHTDLDDQGRLANGR